MRVGQNPAKSIDHVAQPAEITVAVIVYIPFLGGYYAESLDVLKRCLGSIWDHSDRPFDLLVFDNASCPEVRDYLVETQAAGKIQYLLLSDKNIGKGGAWNLIFRGAPGKYLAYADSDVIFYPGWLSAQIEILETHPQVGMVTGMPLWSPEEFSTSTVAWADAEPGVTLERGRFLPWEDYWRHSQSLGKSEAEARAHFDTIEDRVVTLDGKRYYVGAGHFQFVARTDVLRAVGPVPSERPMGQVRALDVAVNAAGYLRLSTSEWWVQHLGNTLPPQAAEGYSPPGSQAGRAQAGGPGARSPFYRAARRVLLWLNAKTFDLLYRSQE